MGVSCQVSPKRFKQKEQHKKKKKLFLQRFVKISPECEPQGSYVKQDYVIPPYNFRR